MKSMSNEDRMMVEDIIRHVVKRIIKLKYGDDYLFREDPEDVYIDLLIVACAHTNQHLQSHEYLSYFNSDVKDTDPIYMYLQTKLDVIIYLKSIMNPYVRRRLDDKLLYRYEIKY